MTGKCRWEVLAFTAVAAVVLLPGSQAGAQRLSEWSAPVNLGPVVNTGFFEG